MVITYILKYNVKRLGEESRESLRIPKVAKGAH